MYPVTELLTQMSKLTFSEVNKFYYWFLNDGTFYLVDADTILYRIPIEPPPSSLWLIKCMFLDSGCAVNLLNRNSLLPIFLYHCNKNIIGEHKSNILCSHCVLNVAMKSGARRSLILFRLGIFNNVFMFFIFFLCRYNITLASKAIRLKIGKCIKRNSITMFQLFYFFKPTTNKAHNLRRIS